MVRHVIHDDANVAFLRFAHHVLEVRHRAILRIDGFVVGNVVAEIHLRRRIHGRDPDRVNAEVFQIIQPRGNAIDVADTIAV